MESWSKNRGEPNPGRVHTERNESERVRDGLPRPCWRSQNIQGRLREKIKIAINLRLLLLRTEKQKIPEL